MVVPPVAGTAYYDIYDDLSAVYLEDSWVLDIETSVAALVFRLDLVLTPAHVAYRQPGPGVAHCYVPAVLRMGSWTAIQFRRSQLAPSVDAAGQVDYGNIDVFQPADLADLGCWELAGDWGEALVRQPSVRVELQP